MEVIAVVNKAADHVKTKSQNLLSLPPFRAFSHFVCHERAQHDDTLADTLPLHVVNNTLDIFVCLRPLFDEKIRVCAHHL
jgi:hypothetical protein